MSGKVKMKCPRCGKHFKSAQARQALCPECAAKERHARAASAAASARIALPTAAPPPKIVGPGAAILVPGLAPTRVAPPPVPPAQRHEPHPPAHAPATGLPQGDHHAKDSKSARPPRPASPPPPVREPREKRPPTPTFVLTEDLRARIEARYLELARPIEFDGIRTQIANELSIPKAAVKQAVRSLRARLQLPSWWDLQAFTGTAADLARIRAAYEPLLPIPPIGVHKQIAADLGLEPVVVYHGIRRIRAEMQLPQYNAPELHPDLPPPPTEPRALSPTS